MSIPKAYFLKGKKTGNELCRHDDVCWDHTQNSLNIWIITMMQHKSMWPENKKPISMNKYESNQNVNTLLNIQRMLLRSEHSLVVDNTFDKWNIHIHLADCCSRNRSIDVFCWMSNIRTHTHTHKTEQSMCKSCKQKAFKNKLTPRN